MIIHKLSIKNYRNFSEFELELKKNTLIIGANNIGKTNLLNALGLIFSNDISFYRKRSLEIDDINYSAIQDFKREIALEEKAIDKINPPEVVIEVLMKNFNEDQQAVVADWFINDNFDEAKLTYVFKPKRDLSEWINNQREKLKDFVVQDDESPDEILKKKINQIDFPLKYYDYTVFGGNDQTKRVDYYFLKMLKMEFLEALRDAEKELVASGNYRLLYRILSNRDAEKFDKLKEKLLELHDEVNSNAELNTIKTEIESYLDKISLKTEENQNNVDFEFSRIEYSELLKKISLLYGNDPINIQRNGLGRNNLLYISLILSHLTGTPITEEVYFRLVGIEEPEAHLHPHLEKHLARNIEDEASEYLQLLITSHSPSITSKLDLKNTVIIYKDLKGRIQSHYIMSGFVDEKGRVSSENKKTINYLRKYLDVTNSEMFYARKLILVEGISEMLLIPKLFERYTGTSLEKEGCSIINVQGVSFKHFLKIVNKGYFIKCLVLTDSDKETATVDRAKNLKQKFNGKGIIRIEISNKSTFEKDLIASNNSGAKKNTLFNALRETRPKKVETLIKGTDDKEMDVNEVFGLIEIRDDNGKKTGDYKSEFASNLLEELSKKENDQFVNKFDLPKYMAEGFDFLQQVEIDEEE